MNGVFGQEIEPTPATPEGIDFDTILASAEAGLNDERQRLEAAQPDKLAPLNEQIEYGRQAAELHGGSKMLERIRQAVADERTKLIT